MVSVTKKVYTTYHDFMPGFKKEEEVYESELVSGYEIRDGVRTNKKIEHPWPRLPEGRETAYKRFMKEITDKSGKHFNPQLNEKGIPVKGTGATYTISNIIRLRTKEGKEFLYSKGTIKGYNSLGELITFHCAFPEMWTRTLFDHKREWDEDEKRIVTRATGPRGSEIVYDLPFNEKNLRMLFEQRENDKVAFVLKDEDTQDAKGVVDQTGIASKTLELFTKPFAYLWNADYLSPQTKAELRAEAQMRGLIPPGSAPSYTPQSMGTGTGPQKPSSSSGVA